MIGNISHNNNNIILYIAIDDAKVSESIDIIVNKYIIGRSYPYHIIDTTNFSKEEINDILNENFKDLALEIKVATSYFQNIEKIILLILIIAARPPMNK